MVIKVAVKKDCVKEYLLYSSGFCMVQKCPAIFIMHIFIINAEHLTMMGSSKGKCVQNAIAAHRQLLKSCT